MLSISNYLPVDMGLCTRMFGSPRILVFNLTNISYIFKGIIEVILSNVITSG
jgi:hypothetical protein